MSRIESTTRSLNGAERRLLRWAISHRKRRLRGGFRRTLTWGGIVFGGLWAFSIFATIADKKGPSWYVSGLIWLGIGLPLTLWACGGARSDLANAVRRFETALQDNTAIEIRIQTEEFVEFEEEEDEGACYAFQLPDRRIVLLSGQQFYSSAAFPNSDFSLVDIPSADGTVIVGHIEKRGHKIEPIRTIPANKKAALRIPNSCQVIDGDLSQIEHLLS